MMFDFTLKCSEGHAVDPVETEDMRKAAEEQVEANLQKAQLEYQGLMKQR